MVVSFLPLGGAQEVGASCGILTLGERRILVDAGMRPAARPGQSRTPDLDQLAARPPDVILITHAHIDHTGCLPLVAGMFPGIPIYATESTLELMRILLLDSARIMEQEHLANELETPLYDEAMVEEMLSRVVPLDFDRPFAPLPSEPEISVRYLRAGHILGAGMLLFSTPHGTILHTGDISSGDHRTIKGVDLAALPEADLMICEGTYGNRTHGSRKEQESRLARTVQAVVGAGGRVLIPAFAVGRAQEVVLILKAFRSSGLISPVNMFVDGMCKSVCDAYQRQSHDLHPALQQYLKNSRRALFLDRTFGIHPVIGRMREMVVPSEEPAIIISTSGMLSGGPAPLYAAALAQHERHAIIFTGYQDEESPGAMLLRTRQGDTITLNRREVRLNCQIHRYSLSGHADANQIEQVVKLVKPRQLVLVHGDREALSALATRFKNLKVSIPVAGEEIVLERAIRPGVSTQPRPAPIALEPVSAPPTLEPPTLAQLYEAVIARNLPQRPWTAIELGQCLYGAHYQPALRPQVEGALQSPQPYFKTRRLGAQIVYLPQSPADIAAMRMRQAAQSAGVLEQPPARPFQAGEVVIVQGAGSAMGSARLGILLAGAPPEARQGLLVAEGWKGQQHPMNVVQLRPGIVTPELIELPDDELRAHLLAWRARINAISVDLMRIWHGAAGAAQLASELLASYATPDEQLALGFDLLKRGMQLWKRQGEWWLPRPRETLQFWPAIQRHMELLASPDLRVVDGEGQGGVLTGRSSWGMVEVQWEATGLTSMVKDSMVQVRV